MTQLGMSASGRNCASGPSGSSSDGSSVPFAAASPYAVSRNCNSGRTGIAWRSRFA